MLRETKELQEIREIRESLSSDLRERLVLRERKENRVVKDPVELMETVFPESLVWMVFPEPQD